MTKDELIAAVRDALAGEPGITEKRMFGGVGFFLHGNMLTGTAGGQFADLLMLRVGKDAEAAALAEPRTRAVEMGGRKVAGYVFVASDALGDKQVLTRWLRRALDHVRTLPRKAKGPTKKAATPRAKRGAKAKSKRA